MRHKLFPLLFTLIALAINAGPVPAAWAAPVPAEGTIAYVIDGDTVALTTGQHIRFLGINAPEVRHGDKPGDPYGQAATRVCRSLLPKGQHIKLTYNGPTHDRYGRLLAEIYLPDGTWVNGRLVSLGAAHVYTFPDHTQFITDLEKRENAARAKRLGIWALPRWQVRNAAKPIDPKWVDTFQLVDGKVLSTGAARDGTVYLNFGTDWRHDFTVEIRPRDLANFTQASINPKTAYTGKTVRVRGWLKPVNGMLITATHPAQIEILTPQP